MLIIDNADSSLCVSDYIPRRGEGRVLITSLNPDWRSIGNVHRIDPFLEPEATAFLERRSGVFGPGAGELARELGCLPLALDHAAAYILATGADYREYLDVYRAHKTRLLREGNSHLSPIVTTWRISTARVQAENSAAVDLLNSALSLSEQSVRRLK
jgi:hypothetical protein